MYNFLISTCGKCKNSDQAIQVPITIFSSCAFKIPLHEKHFSRPYLYIYNFIYLFYFLSFEMKILEEMKSLEVKPNVQTYICLLHACAAQGRLDRVYAMFLLLSFQSFLPIMTQFFFGMLSLVSFSIIKSLYMFIFLEIFNYLDLLIQVCNCS